MSKLIPKNPHDEFFKAVFGKPENTAAFLRRFLPAEVVAVLDLDSLKPVKEAVEKVLPGIAGFQPAF